ncbi:hypothetical protein B0H10DRAFT_520475 [Mycena sp. CBHHK59/15]|nr:hypothetical protein B0H10DRAFT_520475 [Mycena sp. CBHHK59/15]
MVRIWPLNMSFDDITTNLLDKEASPCWLLFDEAQASYWDELLWHSLFKNPIPNVYCVVFCSHGSMETINKRMAPFTIPAPAVLSLWPTSLVPHSLSMTFLEYQSYATFRSSISSKSAVLPSDDVLREVHAFTAGHIGARPGSLQGSLRYRRGL